MIALFKSIDANRALRASVAAALFTMSLVWTVAVNPISAQAAPTLSVEPITWDVVGLDSNKPATEGPDTFPVGSRVCNTGTTDAIDVEVDLVWDSANPYVSEAPGSLTTVVYPTIAAGDCEDVYFNIRVQRTKDAFDTFRRYRVNATAANVVGTATSPTPRQIYVEKLVSQSRNVIDAITGPGNPPAPAPTTVYVGETYVFQLWGSTATNGYEQLETFLNFPNLIFRVTDVSATYSTTPISTNDSVYADACTWNPDPTSGTYRSCLATGKAGGDIVVEYTVEILTAGTATVGALIYDFSGSSYHYNADFGAEFISITAVEAADLSLTKEVNISNPDYGDHVTFTVEVANDGPSTATTVEVTDLLPTGLTFVSALASQGSYDEGTGTWTVGTVAKDGTATIDIVAEVKGTGTISNSAEVSSSDQDDPDSTPGNGDPTEDDQASVVVTVPAINPAMDLTKTSDVTGDAQPGDQVTYTIEVENTGDVTLDDVAVLDPLPDNTQWISTSVEVPGPSTFAGGPPPNLVSGQTLDPSDVMTVTLVVQLDDPVLPGTTDVINSVSATSDLVPLVTDSVSDPVDPGEADISLTKTVNDRTPNVGDTVVFTIIVDNNGPDDADLVEVADVLPTGYSNISSISGGGTLIGSTITWGIGTVAAGSSAELTFEADVDPPTGTPSEYRNIAQVVAASQLDPDSEPSNDDGDQSEDDEDAESIVPQQADLSLEKAIDASAPDVGDTVTFTVTVSNTGPDDATNVAVSDVLPSGYSNISNVSSGGSATGYVITWSGLTIPAMGSAALAFDAVVEVPAGSIGEYTNVAQVTSSDQYDPDSSPGNDDGDQSEDDEDRSTPSAPLVADLSLSKTVSSPTPNVGDVVTFTIAVTNAGSDGATGVAVEDVVPAGYSSVTNISNSGFVSGSTISWDGLAIADGETLDLTFEAIVDVPTGTAGEYDNVAQVTGSNQFDPDSTPDNGVPSEDDHDAATVTPQLVDLGVNKTVDVAAPNVGDVVTFTIEVSNSGPDDASGVSIRDVVPAGYSSINNVSDSGSLVGSIITWNGLSIAASGTISLTFDAVVDASTGTAGEYLNVAQVTDADQYDLDSSPDNDDGDQSEDDEDNVLVDPQVADLSVLKSISDPFAAIGDTVLFTIVVRNAGPDAATNVSVVDVVPPGFGNITSISDSGSLSGSTITWTGITIPADAFEGLTFSADVLAPTDVADEYKNVVQVAAADQYDPDSMPNNDDGDQSEDDEDEAILFMTRADVSIAKTVGDTTPNVGDVVTFSIEVNNAGPDDATGVSVEDVVPGGYSSVTNISHAGSILGSTITWTGLTVANGATLTVAFDATVDAPTGASGEYVNVAQVTDSDLYDPDSTPDNDDGDQSEDDEDDATTMPQVADLSVVKSVDGATPDIGDVVTFTVAVTNNGPDDASGVSVEDVVPAGYSNITTISNSGSLSGSTITWSDLSVPNGVTLNLTFDVTVDAPTGTSAEYDNVAQVTGSDQHDPDSTPDNGLPSEDDQDDASTTPQTIDLSLVKTVDDTSPLVGEIVTFTLVVSNAGPSGATGVMVQDVVPDGYSGITNISNGGTASGSTITWSGLSVANGAAVNLTFDATVDAPPASYTNIAQVTAANEWDPDSAPNNDDGDQSEDDEDSADLTVEEADLRLSKTVDNTLPNVGDSVTFTIAVTNDGPDDAAAVAVEDVVPTGYSNITNISNGGILSGSTITWSGLSIANGDTLSLTFDATVDAPTGGANEYVNVAQVTASDQHDPDSTPDNDDATEDDQDDASVTPQVADLSLAKSVDNTLPNVGDSVTFTIDVANNGPDDATGVSVEDVAPAGYSGVQNISNGGILSGSTITWSGLSIANGDTLSLTFDATVDAPTGGTNEYVNVAQVTDSDQHDPNSTPDNNVPTEDDQDNATVNPQQADLSVTKSVNDTTPSVGDLVTFSVLVANAGLNAATGVSVEDVVPAGYSGITNISHSGNLSSSTVTWSGLFIAVGSATTLMFQAIVDAPTGTSGEYDNVAQVTDSTQYDPDSTPDNDLPAEDDQDDASVTPETADLTLAKAVDDAAPNVGDTVTFTITVTNDGPDTATNVVIEDVVPAGYSGVTNISNGGTLNGSTVTWTVPSIGLGFPNRVTLAFDATVDAPTGASGEYVNVAQVTDSDLYDPDSTPDNDDGDQSEDDEDDATTMPQVADLSVVKSVDGATPDIGDVVTFTVAVTNNGPDDASGVSVEDVVPAGYSNITTISNSGSLSGSTITWSDLSVPNGVTLNLTFDVTVDAPTGTSAEYDNVAQVTGSDQHDPDSTPDNGLPSEDDQDDASTTPQTIDLSLVKTVDDTSPLVGEIVTFTLVVSNAGPSGATGVMVQDVVPDGYSGITNISNGGTASGSTITWSGLSVANGAAVNLTFDATVDAPPASYTNIAQVTAANKWDPDSAPNNDDGDQSEDDEDSADLTVEEADLRLSKTVDNTLPNVGDSVTFTIAVTNDGPDGTTGVSVEDVVPAGYSNITNISNGGILSGSTITWSGLSIANGDTLSLTFDATVDPPTGTSGEYVNVAQVTASDQHDPDSTPDNDDATEDDQDDASVTPQVADLSLAKSVDNTLPNVGDSVTFTIDVANNGPDDATGVSVEDVAPAGYSGVQNISNGGILSGSTITWSGLSIANGDTLSLTFDATVDAPTGGTNEYVNVAQVTDSDQHDPDSTPDNDVLSEDDQDGATTTPRVADLSLAKSVDDTTPNVGDTVTFTITVTNDGPDTATRVTVEDVSPDGYTYAANSIAGGSTRSDALAPVLTWTVASLASGTGNAVQLTFDATVDAPTGGTNEYVNVAQVTASDQHDPDSTPDNDVLSEDDQDGATTTPQVADLRLVKSVDDTTPNVGDTVTFTVAVTNNGPSDASGVSVEDVAPAGYSGVQNISNGGILSGSTITWSGLSIANGDTLSLTFDATVDAPTGGTNEYVNVAQVTDSDQHDPDSTPDNDVLSEDDQDGATTTPQVADLCLSSSRLTTRRRMSVTP